MTTRSFDVFLSHNSKDKPAVRELAAALRARGLNVWLDERELIPGRPWQEALEAIIGTTRSAAVLVGQDGLGPWQDEEMRACLAEFVSRKLSVIPVLLPGAPEKPALPPFLQRFTWVDLREGLTEEGIDRLEWGITGKRPNRPQLVTAPDAASAGARPAPDKGRPSRFRDSAKIASTMVDGIKASEARSRQKARQAESDAQATRRKSLHETLERAVKEQSFGKAYRALMDLREAGEWNGGLSRLERFLFWRLYANFPEPGELVSFVVGWALILVGIRFQIGHNGGCWSIVLVLFLYGALLGWLSQFKTTVRYFEWAFLPLTLRRIVARGMFAMPIVITILWLIIWDAGGLVRR